MSETLNNISGQNNKLTISPNKSTANKSTENKENIDNKQQKPTINPEKSQELLNKLQKADDALRDTVMKDIKDLRTYRPENDYYAFSSWSQCGWSERT